MQSYSNGEWLNYIPLQWRHNGRDSVSNHQPHDCLLNGLFRCRSKKTWKLRVTGLCAVNSPGTGEFPAQMASNAENVSIWWLHHATISFTVITEALKVHRVLWKIGICYLMRMIEEWKRMSSGWNNNIVVTHPDEIPTSAKSSGWHMVVWYVIRMTYYSVHQSSGRDTADS